MKKITAKKATVKRVSFTIKTIDSCREVARLLRTGIGIYEGMYNGLSPDSDAKLKAVKVEDVGEK